MKISDRFTKRFPRMPVTVALMSIAIVACDKGPVEWRGDARELTIPAAATSNAGDETAAPIDTHLVLAADGTPGLEAIPHLAATMRDSTACPGSLRTSALSSTEIYSVWWSHRPGGRAVLLSARSDDAGGTWTPPVPVDTTDRGVSGCARPAPAIAADPKSGYVHVTYFLDSPGGAGVFFAHSMERGEMFHSPVAIMYGDHPSASAVAAADDVVVVAFEDPNTDHPHIALAMSRTWGHIFARDRPEATAGSLMAEKPLIALRNPTVAVAWHEKDRAVVARVGTLK